jgi:hypothetical protein
LYSDNRKDIQEDLEDHQAMYTNPEIQSFYTPEILTAATLDKKVCD